MGRVLGIFLRGCLALLLIASLLIAIFDLQSSPPSKPSSWHAYLTEDELQHPLAQYWFNRAEPASEVLMALNAGSLREEEVLSWDNRQKLKEEGYLPGENGWARFEDGSAYVAVKTFFPDATAEMIDWWFEWAQREEDIRYKIWYPGAHYAMSQAPTPNAPDYEKPKAYWGKSRFPLRTSVWVLQGYGSTLFLPQNLASTNYPRVRQCLQSEWAYQTDC